MTGDFVRAEALLQKAIQIMPNDPIVNDHYGDILWKLKKETQARYLWNQALKMENIEKEFKDKVGETLNFRSIVQGTNVTVSQSQNEITINSTGGRPYTSYTALLSQTGTNAPVATILENTTGNTIVWTRTNTGMYRGTWGTAVSDVNKLYFAPAFGQLKNQTVVINIYSATTTQFQLSTQDTQGGALGTGVLADEALLRTGVEIRIYP